jgi:hypothetical protein
MTTYKKYSIKNRKTRKIKTFKGGDAEGDIKKVAIDTVNTKISTGATGNTPVKSGKKVSILIDFYEKLLKPENYGNNLNFNEFYEIVNINKNGINTAESITGVEELFEIFKKEIKYIKATDEENKVETEKDLKSNLKKTKEIIIDYRDSRKFTIDGEKVAAAPPVSVIRAAPVTSPGTRAAPVQSAVVPLTVVPSTVVPEPSTEESIQETAINVVSDAVINKIVSNKIDDTNPFIDDAILNNLNNKIRIETNELDKNNKFVKKKLKDKKDLEDKNRKLEAQKKDLEDKNRKLEAQKKDLKDKNAKLETEIKTGGNILQKKQSIATEIAKNNNNFENIKSKILANKKMIRDKNTKIHEKQSVIINNNRIIEKLNSQKEYYLKLLNRAYDILIQKLSNSNLQSGIYGPIRNNYDKLINANIEKIKDKINKLEAGRVK